MKILSKFILIVFVFVLILLGTRTYSSFLKNKARATNACYYAGKVYQEGEHYFKKCNGCICSTPNAGLVGLRIGCTEVACSENNLIDTVKDIIFVK